MLMLGMVGVVDTVEDPSTTGRKLIRVTVFSRFDQDSWLTQTLATKGIADHNPPRITVRLESFPLCLNVLQFLFVVVFSDIRVRAVATHAVDVVLSVPGFFQQ